MTSAVTATRSSRHRLERVAWHHPEWTWAVVAAASWALLAALHLRGGEIPAAHHHPGTSPPYPTSWLAAQGGWLLMAAAMMLPPALPMIRHVAMNSRWRRRQRAAAGFVVTYLAVWLLFGAVAVSAVRWAQLPAGGWPLVAALVGAAGWQLTPAKRRWLRAGRRTTPLPPDGRRADAACLRFGLRYGQASVGAGWALMLPMAIAGHASLLLMVAITMVILAEEVLVTGARLVRPAGLVLVAAAVVVAATGGAGG